MPDASRGSLMGVGIDAPKNIYSIAPLLNTSIFKINSSGANCFWRILEYAIMLHNLEGR